METSQKSEIIIPKFEMGFRKIQIPKLMEEQKKKYDLEERIEKFSLRIRNFCLRLKKDVINIEYFRQLVRSAGSIAGNYIEANENLGDGDLRFRIKVCRKESKESKLWLKHVLVYDNVELEKERSELIQEVFELENIFGSILKKLILKQELKEKSQQ